jgi:hypothetical protein
MAKTLKSYLIRYIRDLRPLDTGALLEGRYQKFRQMGVYLTGGTGPSEPPAASANGYTLRG